VTTTPSPPTATQQTIELIGVSAPPDPPSPLNPRIAALVISILVIGGGILAALAGPESVPDGGVRQLPADAP
jgi:hypothetical protein